MDKKLFDILIESAEQIGEITRKKNSMNTDKLRELLAKATALPWKVGKNLGQRADEWIIHFDTDKGRGVEVVQSIYGLADANLIVAAVNALPDLLSEIDRLTGELAEARLDAERLRGFAQDGMEPWPMGDLDGGELQCIAEKHGLLRQVTMREPCAEACQCAEYSAPCDWPVQCYRKTSLLTGLAESDAAIDAVVAAGEGK